MILIREARYRWLRLRLRGLVDRGVSRPGGGWRIVWSSVVVVISWVHGVVVVLRVGSAVKVLLLVVVIVRSDGEGVFRLVCRKGLVGFGWRNVGVVAPI